MFSLEEGPGKGEGNMQQQEDSGEPPRKVVGRRTEKRQQGDQMNPWLRNNERKELILIFLF